MTARMCLGGCGRSTSRAGGRCDDCAPPVARARHNRQYDTAEYRSARNAAVAAHRARHGDLCLRCGPPHRTTRSNPLTANHPVPLGRGGAVVQVFEIGCQSWNSRLGIRQ